MATPVQLHSITYSPVGLKRRPKIDYWARCIVGDKLDDVVRRRFEGYARTCYEANKANFIEVVFSKPDGKFLKNKLRDMGKRELAGKNVARRDIAQELAESLCSKMQNSGHGAPGAIFIIQAEIGSKPYMCIVKLDFGETAVVALGDEVDAELFGKLFERALPQDAKNFRKGVMVPSPLAGDACSVQLDGEADYWLSFVGADPVRPSINASNTVIAVAKEALKEEHTNLTPKMALDIVTEVNKVAKPSAAELAEAVKKATGAKKSLPTLTERFDDRMAAQTLPGMLQVDRFQINLSHGISWSVKAELIAHGIVKVESKGNDVIIRIADSEFSVDPKFD